MQDTKARILVYFQQQMDVCLFFKYESYKFHGSYKKHTLAKYAYFYYTVPSQLSIQLIQLRLSYAIVNCTMQVRRLNLKLQAVPCPLVGVAFVTILVACH